MNQSIFNDIPNDLLIKTLSYETSENLYKRTRQVNLMWQKAAMTVLLSRHATVVDIHYQKELFQHTFNPRLKLDTDFIAILQRSVLESMQSRFSTSTHKLYGSIFLCKLKELPADVISDEMAISLFEARHRRGNRNDETFHPCTVPLLTVALPQPQIDNIIAQITSPSLGSTTQIVNKYNRTLKALASRTPYPHIEPFITRLINELDNEINDAYYYKLDILSTIPNHLTDSQIDKLIKKILTKYMGLTFLVSTEFNFLNSISSRATEEQAYAVFTKAIPQLDDPMALRALEAFSTKLNAKSVASLIACMMGAITTESYAHTFFRAISWIISMMVKDASYTHTFFSVISWIISMMVMDAVTTISDVYAFSRAMKTDPDLMIKTLAFGLTSDQALTMFRYLLGTPYNLDAPGRRLNTLNILAAKLDEQHSDELIIELMNQLTFSIDLIEQKNNLRAMSFEEVELEEDEIYPLMSNILALTIFALKFKNNEKQINSIFEKIASIINRNILYLQYLSPLLIAIIPALHEKHLNNIFTPVFSSTTEQELDEDFCKEIWPILAAIFSKLNQPQKDQVTSKILSAETVIEQMLPILVIVAPQLDSTQIATFISRLPQWRLASSHIESLILLTMIMTTLIPKLNQNQLEKTFLTLAKIDQYMSYYLGIASLKLNYNAAAAAFIFKLSQIQVDSLASKFIVFNPEDSASNYSSLTHFKLLKTRLTKEQSRAYLTPVVLMMMMLLSQRLPTCDMLDAVVPMLDDVQVSEIRSEAIKLLNANNKTYRRSAFLLLNTMLVTNGDSLGIDNTNPDTPFINESLALCNIMTNARMEVINRQQQPTYFEKLMLSRQSMFKAVENTQIETPTNNELTPFILY